MPDLRPIIYIISVLLLALSGIMLIPVAVVLVGSPADGNLNAFLISSAVTVTFGLPGMRLARHIKSRLAPRQLYVLTVASWFTVGAFSALPFILSDLSMSVVDSAFEAVSGITTTGSTVLSGLVALPKSILLWRALLQWLGGIGIIMMVVTILPNLRVGGMRLFKFEAPDQFEQDTLRAREFARLIGAAYLVLSVLSTIAYRVAGMDWFNAAYHAMTTVSTGGFSTSDLSIRQFANPNIVWIGSLFMFLAGLPFMHYVHILHFRRTNLFKDQQVRVFALFLATAALAMTVWLVVLYDMPFVIALRMSVFNTISIATTTGYVSADYNLWGGLAVGMFFFMTFVGACAGSTAGGMKIFRFQIAWIMLRNQLRLMVHPHAVFQGQFGGRTISTDVMSSVIAFSFVFAATIAVLAVALSLAGLDILTSLSGAATAVANVGPGLGGTIGPAGNFGSLPAVAKWLLIIGMLMGRLEILTVLVLFTPTFWRS